MDRQFMVIDTFQSDLKILNSHNHLEMYMNFIYKKRLVKRIHKQVKLNMYKNG